MNQGNNFLLKWFTRERQILCEDGFLYIIEEQKKIENFAKVIKVKKLNALFRIEIVIKPFNDGIEKVLFFL